MTVPSYDDLTPDIPDVVDAEKVDQLALFLRGDLRPSDASPIAESGAAATASFLYACLRLQIPATAPQARPTTNSLQASSTGNPLPASSTANRLPAAHCALQAALVIARDFSPRVRRASDVEVLLDVSGLGRLIGPPPEIERQLAHALFDAGVAASVALGPTQTTARVRAHSAGTGHRLALRDTDHQAPWLHLPVALLRELETLPPRITDRDRARPYETLERWGIATLGELAALPAAALSSRLGRRGLALQRLARGLDDRPFVPDGETPRYVGHLELEWPIDALEPLSFVFARLLEPLSLALERADRGAAAVRLDLRLTDRTTLTRVLQLPAPMRDPRVLRTLLLLDLESHALFAAADQSRSGAAAVAVRRAPPPQAGASAPRPSGGGPAPEVMIDVVTIELDPAPSRITQFSLLQRALPSPEALSTLTARLAALAGDARVGSPALVDSHRPDAFAVAAYAPQHGVGARGADAAGANGAEGAGAVLRRERRSIALSVRIEHGRPVHLASSRRGVPYGAIVQAAGPWRTSGGWWTGSGAGGVGQGNRAGQVSAAGWNRDEWDVVLKGGAMCRIYRDRVDDRWFFDGIYD